MDKKIVDLSHEITHGLITNKGLPAPVVSDFWSREYSAELYEYGTSFHIAKIEMVANTGTYLDTPFHRDAVGKDLSEIPLDWLADLDGLCLDIPYNKSPEIGPGLFKNLYLFNKAILIHTGWSKFWGQEEYQWGHPFLNRDAAELLSSMRPKIVGIDSCNIDDSSGKSRPVHSRLLKDEILIIEHMTNLNQLVNKEFRFFAVPPRFKGVGSFPVRAFAILKN